MKLFRFGQQWINLDHVVHIKVTTPVPSANPAVTGAFEFTFTNGQVQAINGNWNDMESFSKVFNPFV